MVLEKMGRIQSYYIDDVTSRIRHAIISLQNILDMIERTHQYDNSYTVESLRSIEKNIKNLRKFISA